MTSTNTDSNSEKAESNVGDASISANDESDPIVSEDEFDTEDEIVAEAAPADTNTTESEPGIEEIVDEEHGDTEYKEDEDADTEFDTTDNEPLVSEDEFGLPAETTSTAKTSIEQETVESKEETPDEDTGSIESTVSVDEQQDDDGKQLDPDEAEVTSPISEPVDVTNDGNNDDGFESDTTGTSDAWNGGNDTIDSGFDVQTQCETNDESQGEKSSTPPIQTPSETEPVDTETQPSQGESTSTTVQSDTSSSSSFESKSDSTWRSNDSGTSGNDRNTAIEARGEQSTFDSSVENAPVSDGETTGDSEIIAEEEIIPPVETKGRVRSPKELLAAPKNIFIAGIATVLTGIIGVCIGVGHVVKVMLDYLVGFTVLIYLALTGIGLMAPNVVTGLTNGITAVEATTRLGVTAELMMVYVPPIAIGVAISKGLEYMLADEVKTETTTEPAL